MNGLSLALAVVVVKGILVFSPVDDCGGSNMKDGVQKRFQPAGTLKIDTTLLENKCYIHCCK